MAKESALKAVKAECQQQILLYDVVGHVSDDRSLGCGRNVPIFRLMLLTASRTQTPGVR
jgi:hypothetical protein